MAEFEFTVKVTTDRELDEEERARAIGVTGHHVTELLRRVGRHDVYVFIVESERHEPPGAGVLPDLAQMDLEHRAWISACRELRDRGLRLNFVANTDVARAFMRWGEELVALRLTQDPAARERALREKREAYPDLEELESDDA